MIGEDPGIKIGKRFRITAGAARNANLPYKFDGTTQTCCAVDRVADEYRVKFLAPPSPQAWWIWAYDAEWIPDEPIYEQIFCHGCGCTYSRVVGGPAVCTVHADRLQVCR